MSKIETKDWMDIAKELYYHMNPTTKMDVPSSVYETVNKWRYEWLLSESDLDLFEWCLKFKNK
jgi:hypothetical protein